MTTLLVLCLTAVLLLTAEISAYTYRGSYRDTESLPQLPPKPDVCVHGACVVKNGTICECYLGTIVCPMSDRPDSRSIKSYCSCRPGEILPVGKACLCPKMGLMPIVGCDNVTPPTEAILGDLPSVKRQSYDGNVARPTSYRSDGPLRCGYYQCWPTQNGQQCVWIPCNNGR